MTASLMPARARIGTKTALLRALLTCMVLATASIAHAQSCSVTSASGSYGSIDILSGAAVTTSNTFTVTCNNCFLGCSVNVCVQFNQGTPNSSSSARYMGNGTNYLQHELYTDSGHSTVWGSWGYGTTAYGTGGVSYNLSLPIFNGAASQSFTVYGRLNANQQTLPPGTYTWSTPSPVVAYASYSFVSPNCGSNPGNTTNAGSSPWTATVYSNCNISTGNLSFGTASLLTTNIDSTATVYVQCTNTTPYSIGIDNGANASGSQRRMRQGATSNYVSYNLYTDSTHNNAWLTSTSATSCTSGSSSCWLGTGNASTQNITVYGRVPPQVSPPAGNYTDTVVVTVTF